MNTPTEPPQGSPLTEPLDAEHLARLRAELDSSPDDDPVADLLEAFAHNGRLMAEQLVEIAARGDLVALAGLAHQLVSTSGWIGARHLSACARTIEVAAREGRKDDAMRHVAAALEEMERVFAAIARQAR